MARPQKAVGNKRDFTVRIRVTPEEKTLLQKLAAAAGLTASDFIRAKSLNSVPLFRKASPERAAFIAGLAELGKIGSNLNQVARALNRSHGNPGDASVSPDVIDSTLQDVDTLTRQLINILQHGH